MRKLSLLCCVLAAALLFYAGRSFGLADKPKDKPKDQPKAEQPVLRTRVALLNITYVIKYYYKYKTYQDELKTALEPFQKKDAGLKKQAEEVAKQLQDATTPADRRERLEKKLKKLQRELEDNSNDAKQKANRRTEEQMKIIYTDVEDAAQRYARAHDFDLVLHYTDAVTKEESYSGQSIARKLQVGALMPLYAAPGMDISKDLVATLNAKAPARGEEESEREDGR
jgi:Skp family chaperone for outer membrane proteins